MSHCHIFKKFYMYYSQSILRMFRGVAIGGSSVRCPTGADQGHCPLLNGRKILAKFELRDRKTGIFLGFLRMYRRRTMYTIVSANVQAFLNVPAISSESVMLAYVSESPKPLNSPSFRGWERL